VDVRAGVLRKHGIRLRLREQPVRILLLLLEQPGQIVLREEIRLKLWPNDTIVEFDPAINTAIKKLRYALGDSAEEPRYIETVARRGYRFLGEVGVVDEPRPAPAAADTAALDRGDLKANPVSPYQVLDELGSGGMGVVFRARDPRLDREVALKFLPEEYNRHPELLERFRREAARRLHSTTQAFARITRLANTKASHSSRWNFWKGRPSRSVSPERPSGWPNC